MTALSLDWKKLDGSTIDALQRVASVVEFNDGLENGLDKTAVMEILEVLGTIDDELENFQDQLAEAKEEGFKEGYAECEEDLEEKCNDIEAEYKKGYDVGYNEGYEDGSGFADRNKSNVG